MYNLMRDLKQFNDSKFKGVGIQTANNLLNNFVKRLRTISGFKVVRINWGFEDRMENLKFPYKTKTMQVHKTVFAKNGGRI